MVKKVAFINVESNLIQISVFSFYAEGEKHLIYNKNYIYNDINKNGVAKSIINVIEKTSLIMKEPLSNIVLVLPDDNYHKYSSQEIFKNNNGDFFSFISKDLVELRQRIHQNWNKKNNDSEIINIVIHEFVVNEKNVYNRFENFINIENITIKYDIYSLKKTNLEKYKSIFFLLHKYNKITYINPLLCINEYIKNNVKYFANKLGTKLNDVKIINFLDKNIFMYEYNDENIELIGKKNYGFLQYIKNVADQLNIDYNYTLQLFENQTNIIKIFPNYFIFNRQNEQILYSKVLQTFSNVARIYFADSNISYKENTIIFGRFSYNQHILSVLSDTDNNNAFITDSRHFLWMKNTIFFKIIGASISYLTLL